MHRPKKGRQVRTLRTGFRKALTKQVNWLLSPHAVAGIVAIPPTLAWGAVSLPFCVLGDMRDKLGNDREIQIN
jgi:hypothetical protein